MFGQMKPKGTTKHQFASQYRENELRSRMSIVQEIKAAVPKLAPNELAELKRWLDEFFEDQQKLTDEVKAKLDQSRAEIAAGRYRTRQP
jgi:hypothetical protein